MNADKSACLPVRRDIGGPEIHFIYLLLLINIDHCYLKYQWSRIEKAIGTRLYLS